MKLAIFTHTPISYFLDLTMWQLTKMINTANKIIKEDEKRGGR